MPLCPYCGGRAEAGLHEYHEVPEERWAECNRIWCDFFHRGVPLPRLSPQERQEGEEPWAW